MFKIILLLTFSLYLSASNLPILQTGQTKVYQNGDNGTFQAGKKRSYSRKDEIVTDHATGLMWQDNDYAKTKTFTWEKAKNYCANLSLGGYHNWKLPTLKELKSIVDYSKVSPAIDSQFQNVVSGYYWSSTTLSGDSSNAWVVYFQYGNDGWYYETNSRYVRCVRRQ